MIEEKKYDSGFYDSQFEGSYESARIILPLIRQWIQPQSVLDVGCGLGTWLNVWKESGVVDILGVDGDYVDRKKLQISPENFVSRDLKEPFSLDRKFDLVMSLEVGEHLPTEKSSLLIDNLTRHGSIILFSAALLEQHGTYHINEQLPEFWAKFFVERNYVPVDILRDAIWNNNNVEWWYRQNIILYVHRDTLDSYPILKERAKHTNPECLVRIHPLLWKYRNEEVEQRSYWGSFIVWKVSELKKKWFNRNE
jgi:SAM-dependent methyltransferase